MPLIPYPPPPGAESIGTAIVALDAAIAQLTNQNTQQNLLTALSARDTLGITLGPYEYTDPNPFIQEAYKQYFAAGNFINSRAQAGPSGQGVVPSTPAAGTIPISYTQATQAAEQTLESLAVSAATEKVAGIAPAIIAEGPRESGAGTPDPWENVVSSEIGTATPLFFPTDPTDPDALVYADPSGFIPFEGEGGLDGSPGVTGDAPSGGGGILVDQKIDPDAPVHTRAEPTAGAFSTVSGKVLAVVGLIILGLFLVSRMKPSSGGS